LVKLIVEEIGEVVSLDVASDEAIILGVVLWHFAPAALAP
jgi:hypothetical protein